MPGQPPPHPSAGAPPAAPAVAAAPPAAPPAARFVLVEPSHAGNVGAAARALKVMGFAGLVLVRPRLADLHRSAEARALASGATDVLEGAHVVASLAEALHGATLVCATAMTPRDFGPPTHAPREYLPAAAAAGHLPAFVFGPERTGLANDDVYRCHVCLSIPTAPSYGSLNLAQAVQLIAYEWRLAIGSFAVRPRTAVPRLADAAAVQGVLAHWEHTLVQIGFLDPATPRKLKARLNQLLNRAQLTEQEVHILRGMARAAAQAATQAPGPGLEEQARGRGAGARDAPGGQGPARRG